MRNVGYNIILIYEKRYSFTDNVWAAVGGMIFGGREECNQLGQFDKNDNIYIQARYEF